MRIISGERKRAILFAPKTNNIRPTTDRAKESLFNLINLKIRGSLFLDLFSGTGSIGLEAKSRGAKEVVCVDDANESIELINKNKEKTKLDIIVKRNKAESFIKTTNSKFDIIFLDPPFKVGDEEVLDIVKNIFENNILDKDGILIIERQSKKENEDIFSIFDNVEVKKYGKVSFIMLGR